jgi:hypothetical protein
MNIDKLDFFAELVNERLNNDYDLVVAITGEEGIGKSTLAIQLGLRIDKDFDLVKNIAYLPDEREIEDKFHNLQPRQCFVIDEAIRVFYKLRWMDKFQIRLNQMYMTERWQNKCTLLLIPRFTDLNEAFRNHRVNVWIHVIDRGVALVFKKISENIFSSDPWKMKENDKLLDKYLIKTKKLFGVELNEYIEFLSKNTPNFVTALEFDDLDEDIKYKYRELKAAARPLLMKMMARDMTPYQEKFMVNVLKELVSEGKTLAEIAEEFDVPYTFLRNLWMLKIAPSERHEIRRKLGGYFEQNSEEES